MIALVLVHSIVAYWGVTAFTGNPHLAQPVGGIRSHVSAINELIEQVARE